MSPRQGDIYLVDLGPVVGTEMAKKRPAIVISNDAANLAASRVSVIPITTSGLKRVYPFEVVLPAAGGFGLDRDSKAACDQVRTLDKKRLVRKLGGLDEHALGKVKAGLRLHFDM